MGASIHINGTGSSIVDTVLVCRSTGSFPRRWLAQDATGVAEIVRLDVADLAEGGLTATQGDIRCICFGHLIRLAIWHLRKNWNINRPVSKRMDEISRWISEFGGVDAVLSALEGAFAGARRKQTWALESAFRENEEGQDEVSFEAKLTEDDGTARDKVTRIQHLQSLSTAGQPPGQSKFEVIACIAGRGFGVRREDMKKLLIATRGKVFTPKELDRLVDCTELKNFKTKK